MKQLHVQTGFPSHTISAPVVLSPGLCIDATVLLGL